ncbi:MAG: carboxypeptidase-like regulatory domain-containing protein, partial [Terriglobales bacterium]
TQGSVSLQVGETEILFSGKVIGSNGPALPKATVMANGVTTTTDTHGAFALNVPAVKDNRYVVTVSKVGYAAASRIFDSGASGTIWKLTRATNLPLNPATGGKFFDERSLVVRVPTEGGKYRTTKMSGATVNLKPNTLVDSHGKPAKKPLRMSLTTVNLSTDPLPGDYGAIDSTGQETNLLSFGAASIEIRDAQGKPYNLASGSTAQIILPIHPAHLANAASPPPTTIPLWTYDEKTGYWKEEGVAKRAGTNYVAVVKHFSYNNTDLSKQTASCMRVNVAQGSSLLGLKVKLSSAAFPQTFELLLDNQINAYYRLIPNTNVTLQVEDSNGNIMPNIAMFDAAHNLIPGNSVNTGAALPAGQTLWPPYPYTPCGVEVNLEQTIPPWSGAPGSPFLTFKGEISDAETNAYYAVIDPNSNRTTLGGWWGQNGFDAVTGANGTRTAYLNNNDLGFGRDMHCLQTGADVACYVTNYGHPDQDPANADLAQTADKTKAVATVCMEWKAVDGQPANNRIVKFFIFQGGSANGGRLTAADLDGFGGKHAPNLCNVCHGGNYQPANSLAPTLAEVNTGASFREFDLTSLKYPAANPQALQEANFKVLNQIVAASAPAGAITDLVNGWYAGNSATQITTYVPTGWTATPQKHDLYANVVAKSCRTCHVAQDAVSNNSVISWLNYSMFQQKRGTIQAFVCGANKLMPQALVTYKNFWLSTTPSSPQALGTFSANDWASFGGCQ